MVTALGPERGEGMALQYRFYEKTFAPLRGDEFSFYYSIMVLEA